MRTAFSAVLSLPLCGVVLPGCQITIGFDGGGGGGENGPDYFAHCEADPVLLELPVRIGATAEASDFDAIAPAVIDPGSPSAPASLQFVPTELVPPATDDFVLVAPSCGVLEGARLRWPVTDGFLDQGLEIFFSTTARRHFDWNLRFPISPPCTGSTAREADCTEGNALAEASLNADLEAADGSGRTLGEWYTEQSAGDWFPVAAGAVIATMHRAEGLSADVLTSFGRYLHDDEAPPTPCPVLDFPEGSGARAILDTPELFPTDPYYADDERDPPLLCVDAG